jgi:hypothetical protein
MAYTESLRTLKIGNNKLKSLEKILAFVGKMKQLTKLDLAGNEVCEADEYREKILAAM